MKPSIISSHFSNPTCFLYFMSRRHLTVISQTICRGLPVAQKNLLLFHSRYAIAPSSVCTLQQYQSIWQGGGNAGGEREGGGRCHVTVLNDCHGYTRLHPLAPRTSDARIYNGGSLWNYVVICYGPSWPLRGGIIVLRSLLQSE